MIMLLSTYMNIVPEPAPALNEGRRLSPEAQCASQLPEERIKPAFPRESVAARNIFRAVLTHLQD
jgi:hypothetical protein